MFSPPERLSHGGQRGETQGPCPRPVEALDSETVCPVFHLSLLVLLGHMLLDTVDPDFAFCLQGETRHSSGRSEVTNISPSEGASDIWYKNRIGWLAFPYFIFPSPG